MNGILNWKAFDYKFSGNPQAAFETLAYHMFCRKYHITEGLPAFYNQKHIETDPYTCDDGTVVGFQAKYYSTPSITAAQESELIKAIEGAKATYDGINMLCFYLSRPFSQSSAKGETKTAMQKEIENKAEKSKITIEWIVPSYFEKILNEPENADLREYFFCVEPSGGEQRVLPKCLTTIPSIDRNIGIIGRDEVIQNLRKMLDENGCIALISGLGGIGKTTVMRWICNSIKEDGNVKNHVAWITCGKTLQNDIVLLRDAFGIPDSDDEKTTFKQIIERMKRFRGTLYLFMDNMYRNPDEDEMEILNSLYPNVHILISSRHMIEDIPFVNLEVLEHDQAVEMFYRYYGQVQERMCKSTAGSIVDTVYRHTLLVELLAKAAGRSGGTLEDFNEKLKKENFFNVFNRSIKTKHDKYRTIEDSVIKLYEISRLTEEQQHIMKLFSIFTAEKEIYYKVVEWAELDPKAMDELVDLAWLEQGGLENGYHIHQIIKDSLLRQMGKSGDELNIEEYGKLLEKVADTASYMPNSLEYTKVQERLTLVADVAKHVDRRTEELLKNEEWSEKDKKYLMDSSVLFHNISDTYYSRGNNDKALTYLRKALDIRVQVSGDKQESTAEIYNDIAIVYRAQGDYRKALEYFDIVLRIREELLGKKDIKTAETLNNIGIINKDLGDYEKALKFYEKALTVYEELYRDHPDKATVYDNIAVLYREKGDYKKALDYHCSALSARENILGEIHPDTAVSYNNIGLMYYELGDYKNALYYYYKTLDIRNRLYGTEHPHIATTYNNIALVHYMQGDYKKALDYHHIALDMRLRLLGEIHSDIAMSYHNIASVLREQKNYTDALDYCRKALLIWEQVLGSKHPITASGYNSIAKVYYAQGDYKKALEYYEKALSVRIEKLGENHPYTKSTQQAVQRTKTLLELG